MDFHIERARFFFFQISPAELRARASPTDAVTTTSCGSGGGQRRGAADGNKMDLQSANSSVCGGDDPEDLTVNSSSVHGNHLLPQHHHQHHLGNNNPQQNHGMRFGPADVHQQLQQNMAAFPTTVDLIDNYARSGGGGALSPFLQYAAKGGAGDGLLQPGDKMYNNNALIDSYLKALVEKNSPLFYASKIASEMNKHHDIAADDAEYSSASDEEDDDDAAEEEEEELEEGNNGSNNNDGSSVNNSPVPLQAGKN